MKRGLPALLFNQLSNLILTNAKTNKVNIKEGKRQTGQHNIDTDIPGIPVEINLINAMLYKGKKER